MENKTFAELQIKSVEEGDGRTIEGYGSVFLNVDSYKDIVAPGAFAKSLQSGRKVKMLYNHDSRSVCGVWDEIVEDGNGLRVKGRLLNTPLGNEVKELVKAGAIDSLSIGYRTLDYDYNEITGIRTIKEAQLFEVSIVTFPANEEATIDSIKAAEMSKTDLERFLTSKGMSRSCAKGLIAKGYDGFISKKQLREAVEDSDEQTTETEINKVDEAESKAAAELLNLINKRIENLK